MDDLSQVTELLKQWTDGRRDALDQLIPRIYSELRKLALSYLRRERADHSLQPTALVHEAFLKLVDQHAVQWQNRAHFFGIAAQAMRRILVDHARAHAAEKRGSGERPVAIDDNLPGGAGVDINVIALDEALCRLAALDLQQSRIVELRYFGGLTVEEIADVLGISPETAKRDWRMAKAWLFEALTRDDAT